MNKKNTFILLSVFLALGACTGVNKTIYEINQNNEKRECDWEPPSQVQACLDRVGMTYEEYEEGRKEVLEKD